MNIIKTNLQYKNPLEPLSPDKVLFIVVHHIEASHAQPEDIHMWHLENGWSGFGYNEYIRKDGTVYIGRGDNVGAHTKGYNEQSYGVALEGDYNKEYLPIPQYNSLVERLKYHKNRFKNLKSICGHRTLNNTECPGKNIDLSPILEEVSKSNSTPTHWALKDWEELNKKGIAMHEQRFDDYLTRGEACALLNRIVKG